MLDDLNSRSAEMKRIVDNETVSERKRRIAGAQMATLDLITQVMKYYRQECNSAVHTGSTE